MKCKIDTDEALKTVRIIAARLRRYNYCALQLDELMSIGWIALQRARDRYNTNKGTTFLSYASHRIRGAMLDAMRKYDGLPSRSVKHYSKWSMDRIISFNTSESGHGILNNAICGHDILADNTENILDKLVRHDTITHIWDIIDYGTLNNQERQVMYYRFKEGLTQKEVGCEVGVNESRICQIQGSAIRKIKKALKAVKL